MRETKGSWEIEQAKEIRVRKDGGKKLWKHINKLSGKTRDEAKTEIYKNGIKLSGNEGPTKFLNFWRNIYSGKDCKIDEAWNENIKTTLMEEMEEERSKILWYRESNGNRNIENNIIPMREIKMNQEDLKREIKKMKIRKKFC